MKLSMIAAMTHDRVIGKDNRLLWHLPKDLEWFKEKTMGCPVIMGRNTFESIGYPLPGRKNIVLSASKFERDGVVVAYNEIQALREAYGESGCDEVFIVGGERVYECFLRYADRLYITFVNANLKGDVYFPEWGSEWTIAHREFHPADEQNEYDLRFLILDKKRSKRASCGKHSM